MRIFLPVHKQMKIWDLIISQLKQIGPTFYQTEIGWLDEKSFKKYLEEKERVNYE